MTSDYTPSLRQSTALPSLLRLFAGYRHDRRPRQKPKLTGRLVAAELEAIADAVRRLSMKSGESALEAQAKIATRLEQIAQEILTPSR
ncbi:MAG: hypothetical protein WBA62_22990 [Xanthobacteraceae bacterium]